MKCEDYRILIEDYVDGALDQKAAARVTAHTASCGECASFYQEMSREQEVYARYQRDVEVGPVLWASIETRIKHERSSQPDGLISRLRQRMVGVFSAPRLSPAFASLLVIVAIGVTVFVMSRLNPRGPTEIAQKNSNAGWPFGTLTFKSVGAGLPSSDNSQMFFWMRVRIDVAWYVLSCVVR